MDPSDPHDPESETESPSSPGPNADAEPPSGTGSSPEHSAGPTGTALDAVAQRDGHNDDHDDHDDDHDPTKTRGLERGGSGTARPNSLRGVACLLLGASSLWAVVLYLRWGPAPDDVPPLAVIVSDANQTREPSAEAKEKEKEKEAAAAASDAVAPIATQDDDLSPTPVPTGPARRKGPWYDANWAEDLDLPRTVTYAIRSGGSLKNVANLFKIYHHEIVGLNPGIGLDQLLGARTNVVVYRGTPQGPSNSLGYPGDGKLQGGVPMIAGDGRSLRHIPWKSFASAATIAMLDRVLSSWPTREPGAHAVLVGNLSQREGGRLRPHRSHQSGRDFDLSYIQREGVYDELNWREMTSTNLDAERTWSLIKLLVESRATEVMFIDRGIQRLLYDHALAQGTLPKRDLGQWLQYPRSTPRENTLIQHVPGHVDHLHVRFGCPANEMECRSRRPELAQR
ncbi:MAG: penicillin-insensitive murein endopeptidase [Nannocystaceae bacterium]